ncbi:hypothetical protein KY289_019903 [Solanum tuberosum]|nr:hypothetical protein KY289_019903 [Solanum tuberosum]
MSGLTALNLIENNLTGYIPPEIGKLKQLQAMDGNELSGSIPECLGNLGMLLYLSLGSNKFSPKFPLSLWKMSGLLYLNMSHNSIEGEVPPTIGELKAIEELYLSGNHFSGQVPSRLGDLQRLKSLDLSNNSFSGSIPLSITNLMSLEDLDLSLNALSGIIPKSLEKLSYLTSINVSFNDLEGEIPSGGVFVNSTQLSFLGNKGLCGMHILELPACPITNPGQQSVSKKLVLKIVTPVVISFFLIFLLVSIWIMKRKKKGKSKDVEKVLEIKTNQLISYHEIQQATNNFDGSNLIAVSKSLTQTETLGTLGYIAPEYGSEGIVSASGDVYSYGIMLMEVLTKRRPTDEKICNENLDLRRWITQSFSGSMMDVVDANLFCEEEQITSKSEMCIASMIELALDCTKETPECRISMKEVVKRLNKINNTFVYLIL